MESRHKEFMDAIKVIQKAFNEKLVVFSDWSKDSRASGLFIDGSRFSLAEWYSQDQYDRGHSAFYLNEHAKLKLIDPVDVLRKELEAAKKTHDDIQKQLERTAKERAEAFRKVSELTDKLAGMNGL